MIGNLAQIKIKKAIDLVPDKYKDQRQYIYCIDFFKNDEIGLALESLIELTDEIDHIFSNDYWDNLIIAADKMGLKEQAEYCRLKLVDKKID
jgi:hypothetical protein